MFWGITTQQELKYGFMMVPNNTFMFVGLFFFLSSIFFGGKIPFNRVCVCFSTCCKKNSVASCLLLVFTALNDITA